MSSWESFKFFRERYIGIRFFQRIEFFPLDIFNQRNFRGFHVGRFADDDGHIFQTRSLSCPPSSFAGDNFITIFRLTDNDRLDNAAAFTEAIKSFCRSSLKFSGADNDWDEALQFRRKIVFSCLIRLVNPEILHRVPFPAHFFVPFTIPLE